MRRVAFLAAAVLVPAVAFSQRPAQRPNARPDATRDTSAQGRADTTVETTIFRDSRPKAPPREVHVVTHHTVTIGGKRID